MRARLVQRAGLAVVKYARASARQGRLGSGARADQGPLSALAGLLDDEVEDEAFARLRAAESIGRPLGGDRFIARLERQTGRLLKPAKRGPKPASQRDGDNS